MTHPLTFPRGGIHLPPRSQEIRRTPIANAAMPSVAVVPICRRGGSAAVCLVQPGERVAEGQLIGRPSDRRSVPVHAPIPGTVVAVRDVVLCDGTTGPAAVIELGGAFAQSGRPRPARDWKKLRPDEILALIGEAGVALDGHPEPRPNRGSLPSSGCSRSGPQRSPKDCGSRRRCSDARGSCSR
jgi:electron transport complex protein RnfC